MATMTLKKSINSTQMKSTERMQDTMDKVLERAKFFGASDAAVSLHHNTGFDVNVRMGEVETVEFSDDNGLSVTVYKGKRKGSASSTDTSDSAIDSMLKAACDIAQVSAEDPCFGLADKSLINNKLPNLDLFHLWDIEPQEAIKQALSCEKQAIDVDHRITNSDGVNLSTYSLAHGYANTHGCNTVIQSTRHGASCSLIAQEGELMQRDYDYTTARSHNDLLVLDQLAKQAAQRTLGRLGARPIKTQKAPVVFSSRLSYGLFSSLISAISGSNVYRKNSFLLDAIGQQIFPENISVYEQPHLLKGLGSSPIDGEGVPTRNNHFIVDGCLEQYALGSYSARRLGLKTTANSNGVFNLTIDPTCGGMDEVLDAMGTGLLVTELMGQGVNVLTGDYSRGASGYWVEGGKIQFPVEEITIAGNLKQMFADILAVGSDINPNVSTRCGSVLIKEMMIAGS